MNLGITDESVRTHDSLFSRTSTNGHLHSIGVRKKKKVYKRLIEENEQPVEGEGEEEEGDGHGGQARG